MPIGRLALAVHPDRKGWICIYTVRVCLILLIAVVAEWFCAFHCTSSVYHSHSLSLALQHPNPV